jgi:tripartite-type tricarboxylate transporter receptor subunit TctC
LPVPWSAFATDYPNKPIELIVPSRQAVAPTPWRASFSEVAKKHLSQPLIVNNKPGASGVIGMSDVLNGRSDGYKVCMVIADVTTLPNLGLAKFDCTNFQPVARLNADRAAITVRAECAVEHARGVSRGIQGQGRRNEARQCRQRLRLPPLGHRRKKWRVSSSTMCRTWVRYPPPWHCWVGTSTH